MATVTKEYLSASTTGQPVQVVATATAGTTIHTAHATAIDEVWLKASNTSGTIETLTLEFGGTGSGNTLEFQIPANDTVVIVAGDILGNSLVLAAFSTTTNVVKLVGYVNRYTP